MELEQEAGEREIDGVRTQVVEFRLGGDVCAIDIEKVDSIVEITKVTRVPRTPPAVTGVMDLRGETTAILDPKEFLGIETTDELAEQKVLVLDRDDDKQKIGIRVDEVLEVTSYTDGQVDAVDRLENLTTEGIERRAAKGIIRKPDGDDIALAIWLDIDAIIERLKE